MLAPGFGVGHYFNSCLHVNSSRPKTDSLLVSLMYAYMYSFSKCLQSTYFVNLVDAEVPNKLVQVVSTLILSDGYMVKIQQVLLNTIKDEVEISGIYHLSLFFMVSILEGPILVPYNKHAILP